MKPRSLILHFGLIFLLLALLPWTLAQDVPEATSDPPAEATTEPPTETPPEPTAEPTAEITAEPVTETPTAEITAEAPTPEQTTEPPQIPPEPALSLALSENFDSGLNGWILGAGWSHDGHRLQLSGSDQAAAFTTDPLQNLAVQIRVQIQSGAFRLNIRHSVSGSYSAVFRADGRLELYRAGVLLTSAQVSPSGEHTLRVSAVDNVVRVSVDGAEIIAYVDGSPLPSGGISLAGYGISTLAVDDMEIRLGAGETLTIPAPPADVLPVPGDCSSVTPITFGNPPTNGTISTVGEKDCFTFTGAVGDQIRVRKVNTSGNFNSGIEVLRPNDLSLIDSIFSTITPSLIDSGQHTIVLQGSGTGSYAIGIQRLNDPVGCTAITFGNPPTSGTYQAGEIDCYTFTGAASDQIRIRMVNTSGNINAGIEVADPDGLTLIDSIFNTITAAIVKNGQHTILVDGSGSGSYAIGIQRLNDPVGCAAITFGNPPTSGTYQAGEIDCYTFTGAASDQIRIRMVNTSGNINAGIEVADPDGLTLIDSIFNTITAAIVKNGQHTILVDGSGSGSYAIGIQRLNDPVGCTAITFGNPPTSGTYQAGEIDCYTFTGAASDQIRIRMVNTSGNINAGIEVADPDGLTLIDSIFNTITAAIVKNGQHTILVDGSGSGSYAIGIQRLNDPVGCAAINYGDTLNESYQAGEIDCFVFIGAANREIRVQMTKTSGNINAGIEVADPDGLTLIDSIFNNITTTMVKNGQHTILIDGSGTGTYRVTLTCLTNCPARPTEAPIWIAPANNAILPDNTPEFSWTPVTGALDYLLQCFTRSNLTNSAFQVTVVTTTHTPGTPLADGQYWCRVRAQSDGGGGPWSRTRHITIDTQPPANPPTLDSPRDGAVVKTTRPRFAWRSVRTASTYILEIDEGACDFAPALLERSGLRGTGYTLNQSLQQGEYCWRMAAVDAAGNQSEWNAVPRTFAVNLQTAPTDGKNFVTLNPARTRFTWARGIGAALYELEIFDTPTCDPGSERYNFTTTSTSHTLPVANALGHGQYGWHINLDLGSGLVKSPFCWDFTVTPAPPPAPRPASPPNNARINTNVPLLDWPDVVYAFGPVTYELMLYSPPSTAAPISLPGSEYQVPSPLSEGRWCWKVRAINNLGVPGAWSGVRCFIVNIQISPPNGAFLVTNAPPARVRFLWGLTPGGVGYELEVFDGAGCATLRYEFLLLGTSHILPPASALPHGVYTWRVNVDFGSGLVTSPFCWLLTVTPSAPPRPVLISPAGGAIVTTATPTLTWNAVTYPTAVTYRVQVDNNSNFSSPEVDVVVATTSHTLAAPLPEGIHYWRVRALNNLNLGGLWSAVRRFRVDLP